MKVLSIDDYIITKEGKVINKKKGNILKPQLNGKGYLRVSIGKQLKFVHRLVAEKYIPNPNNLPQVNHKDGNKLNNCVDNLEWVTPKENIKHAIINGFRDCHGAHKLSVNDVKNIKKLFSEKSMKEIAEMYNVSLSCIKHIHAGHTWKNI